MAKGQVEFGFDTEQAEKGLLPKAAEIFLDNTHKMFAEIEARNEDVVIDYVDPITGKVETRRPRVAR